MKSQETPNADRLAEARRKAMERQIAHGVGPSDEPWPLLFAFVIFILMLVPFMIHWPDSKVVQREHDTRDWLKDQLMERSNHIGRPRTYARQ